MRTAIILLLTLAMSSAAFSQIEVAAGGGISNRAALIHGQLGYGDGANHAYINFVVHTTSNESIPDPLGIRYGYLIGKIEPSIGVDYMKISDVPHNDKYRGWAPGAGLAFKPNRFMAQAGISGLKYPIVYFTILIYGRR